MQNSNALFRHKLKTPKWQPMDPLIQNRHVVRLDSDHWRSWLVVRADGTCRSCIASGGRWSLRYRQSRLVEILQWWCETFNCPLTKPVPRTAGLTWRATGRTQRTHWIDSLSPDSCWGTIAEHVYLFVLVRAGLDLDKDQNKIVQTPVQVRTRSNRTHS